MRLEQRRGGWVIAITFAVSLMFAVMPLPSWAVPWRPDWVTMVLIYWCIALPKRVGIATGWLVGLTYDALTDTLLGLHAFSLCILAYISIEQHRRIRVFPWWQQSVIVGVFVALGQLPAIWIHGTLGYETMGWFFLYPAVSSVILWRWVFVILRDMRRIYHVF